MSKHDEEVAAMVKGTSIKYVPPRRVNEEQGYDVNSSGEFIRVEPLTSVPPKKIREGGLMEWLKYW